jgi:citrate synthase
MPDSCANALRPTPGQAAGSGCPNAYAAHSPNLRAQDRSTGSPIAADSLMPNPYRNARMQDSSAMSGALHGGASLGAETLMAAASGPDDVPRVVAELLRRGEKVPGFGHFVYRGGDPRAVLLLDLVRRAEPKSGQLAVADAVFAEVRQKSLPEPNIDFAIATLVRVAGMVRGAGEAIFAVARTAGWIAHALEAYSGPGPLRPRAVYTGRPAVGGP